VFHAFSLCRESLNLDPGRWTPHFWGGSVTQRLLFLPFVCTKTWWLMWNKVRPCLVRLNRYLFSSMQKRRVKQLRKTSKCEKEKCLIDYLLFFSAYTSALFIQLNSYLFRTRLMTYLNSISQCSSIWTPNFILLGLQLNLISSPHWFSVEPNSLSLDPSWLGLSLPWPWPFLTRTQGLGPLLDLDSISI
jgi:hypothetical protein